MKRLSLYSTLFALLSLLTISCEKDDLTPQFESIFGENLVVQYDTAQILKESTITIFADSSIYDSIVHESIGDFIYTEYQDSTNQILFEPRIELLSYTDMEMYLSADSILSGDDVQLPFQIIWSHQTESIDDLHSRSYLIAYRSSLLSVFSIDKFNLVE